MEISCNQLSSKYWGVGSPQPLSLGGSDPEKKGGWRLCSHVTKRFVELGSFFSVVLYSMKPNIRNSKNPEDRKMMKARYYA